MSKALISISAPPQHRTLLDAWADTLRNYVGEIKCVDTVAGWWCLNQDWYEFHDDIETDWQWVRPKCLPDDTWLQLYRDLQAGRIIMMVHYQETREDGTVEYCPHC